MSTGTGHSSTHMDRRAHWQTVFDTKASTEVSWYQPHLRLSLELIERTGVAKDAQIIDVGGGDSMLVDDLLDMGFPNITVLDVAPSAIARVKQRLGSAAAHVHWIESDILEADLPANRFDLWHDRAVFHFLTEQSNRVQYLSKVTHALKPGGHLILATFADDGPQKCSGLPTMRYGSEDLIREFGESFSFVESERESHITPKGIEQRFIYCRFKKR